ncbi:MAG: SsrA-binding protein SmpB [Candidatus Omnitrophota bacterium]
MQKLIATNKKAYHNYFLEEKWECGIALTGGEVKSIRAGLVNFKNSYAHIDEGELFLYDLHILAYKEASYLNEVSDRKRKLLVHSREMNKMESSVREKGLALVPTKLYFNDRGLVKVEVAVARGKKMYDKREDIKKRAVEKGLKRAIKQRR